MNKGRKTCDILKAIRSRIAEANGIDYEYTECTFEGDCTGTCPKCQADVEFIESQLSKKSTAGESVEVKGIASDIIDDHKNQFRLNYDNLSYPFPVLILDGVEGDEDLDVNNPFLSVKREIDEVFSDFALNNPDCDVVTTTIHVSDKCQAEIEEYIIKNHDIKYAPVILLMVNSQEKMDFLLENIELMQSPFYKIAIKVAFETDTNNNIHEKRCFFTGSEEAVWSYSQVQELRKVIRVIRLHRFSDDYLTGDIIANPDDHVTSGVPLLGDVQSPEFNDEYDEWD